MSPDGRPAFLPPLLDAFKAKPGQIKLIDKDIDRPVLSSPNSQLTARETKCSECGHRIDKARHQILRPNRRRIISLTMFSHFV
jgi:hypothetical protein